MPAVADTTGSISHGGDYRRLGYQRDSSGRPTRDSYGGPVRAAGAAGILWLPRHVGASSQGRRSSRNTLLAREADLASAFTLGRHQTDPRGAFPNLVRPRVRSLGHSRHGHGRDDLAGQHEEGLFELPADDLYRRSAGHVPQRS